MKFKYNGNNRPDSADHKQFIGAYRVPKERKADIKTPLIAVGVFVIASMKPAAPAIANEQLCGDDALNVASNFTNLDEADGLYIGFWLAVSVCHALVVLDSGPTTARVAYIWYGLPGSSGSQRPADDEQVIYQARVSPDGSIIFQAHWRPTISYRNTSVTCTDSTGSYLGTVRRVSNPS